MVYRVRCMTTEEYTALRESSQSLNGLNISIINDYHRNFFNRLEKIFTTFSCVVFEYPREMCIEVSWLAGRIKSGRLREVKFEMLHRNFVSPWVDEILVIGEGYDAN